MVHTQYKVGLFGKLPHYGDFLTRDLPSNCIEVWDAWLQGYISGAQEQLGGGWLDVYLTSPIWRFVLSPGVIDNHTWLGVMLPSVDRVGRYFPFSVLVPVTTSLPATLIHEHAGQWFEQVEHAVLDALDHSTPIEALSEQLNHIALLDHVSYQPSNHPASHTGTVIPTATAPADSSAYALMMGQMMQAHHGSYSIWSTQGSEFVEPCMMSCQALPAISAIAAMLDGDWLQSQWQVPYHFIGEHGVSDHAHAGTNEQNPPEQNEHDHAIVASHETPIPAPSSEALSQSSSALGAFDDQIEKMMQPNNSPSQPKVNPSVLSQPQAEYNPDITQPWPLDESEVLGKPNANQTLDTALEQVDDQIDHTEHHHKSDSSHTSLSSFEEPHDIVDAQADPFDHLGVFDDAPLANDHSKSTDTVSQDDALNIHHGEPKAEFDISGIDAAQIDLDHLDPFESELAKFQAPPHKKST